MYIFSSPKRWHRTLGVCLLRVLSNMDEICFASADDSKLAGDDAFEQKDPIPPVALKRKSFKERGKPTIELLSGLEICDSALYSADLSRRNVHICS